MECFAAGDELILAVANVKDDATTAVPSVLYARDGSGAFRPRQEIPTFGAHDIEPFMVGGARYIAIANQGDGTACGNDASGVDVYVHAPAERGREQEREQSPLFRHQQRLATGCAVFAHTFEAHGSPASLIRDSQLTS